MPPSLAGRIALGPGARNPGRYPTVAPLLDMKTWHSSSYCFFTGDVELIHVMSRTLLHHDITASESSFRTSTFPPQERLFPAGGSHPGAPQDMYAYVRVADTWTIEVTSGVRDLL